MPGQSLEFPGNITKTFTRKLFIFICVGQVKEINDIHMFVCQSVGKVRRLAGHISTHLTQHREERSEVHLQGIESEEDSGCIDLTAERL